MDIYNEYDRFDDSNDIHPTAIIHPNVKLGKNNKIGAYVVIGGNGEIRGTNQFEGRVEIGDNNVISELVTIQRPEKKGAKTMVGSGNIIMAHSHIGHDAVIGNDCELSTGTIIGGYAVINNGSKLKLNVTVRNRKNIGENCVVGMGAVVVSDLDSDKIYIGNPAKELKR